MIRSESIDTLALLVEPENAREVDPFNDPEIVRLVAANLEMAVRNLMIANSSPDCLVVTADICSHKLVAAPQADGSISVTVYDE